MAICSAIAAFDLYLPGNRSTASTSHNTDDDRARRRSIAFLNWAHALDHFVLLIYPTVVIGLEVVYRRPTAS